MDTVAMGRIVTLDNYSLVAIIDYWETNDPIRRAKKKQNLSLA